MKLRSLVLRPLNKQPLSTPRLKNYTKIILKISFQLNTTFQELTFDPMKLCQYNLKDFDLIYFSGDQDGRRDRPGPASLGGSDCCCGRRCWRRSNRRREKAGGVQRGKGKQPNRGGVNRESVRRGEQQGGAGGGRLGWGQKDFESIFVLVGRTRANATCPISSSLL